MINYSEIMHKKQFTRALNRLSILVCMLVCMAGTTHAQITIPGTKVTFNLSNNWKYLSTTQSDNKTIGYLYCSQIPKVSEEGDSTLPFLKIVVRKNYTGTVFDYAFERYNNQPYQSMDDYVSGPGLPKTGGLGYVGAYTNTRDGKDYQFMMVYFKEKNTIVEFRLETTRDTYSDAEAEFVEILNSISF